MIDMLSDHLHVTPSWQ